MKSINWIISKEDYLDYRQKRLDRPSAESIRKYYSGFKGLRMKDDPIFKDELDDLEGVYTSTLRAVNSRINDILPSLLYYMGEFVELHNQSGEIAEKLDNMRAKLGLDIGDDDE